MKKQILALFTFALLFTNSAANAESTLTLTFNGVSEISMYGNQYTVIPYAAQYYIKGNATAYGGAPALPITVFVVNTGSDLFNKCMDLAVRAVHTSLKFYIQGSSDSVNPPPSGAKVALTLMACGLK